MTYVFAPMEGLTGRLYRRTHRRFFSGVARYYAPFYAPTADHRFPPRELKELLPEENPGVPLVPQLLTNRAEDFLWAAGVLRELGYTEIDLNLGCPSGTVVAKRKGAGFLSMPEALAAFFDALFSSPALDGLSVSVKTRLGMKDPAEFPALLDIFRRYPISLLIVHPRLRDDQYKGAVRPEPFAQALEASPFPVAWNGDLFTAEDAARLKRAFPRVQTAMLGRGLVADPDLAQRLTGGEAASRETLRDFHDALCGEYRAALYGDTALCHRMKEFWSLFIRRFAGNDAHYKRLCKAKSYGEYTLAAAAIFAELPLLPEAVWR